MEEITRKIELYHNLFLGCLLLCILCVIVAVTIFFVLDIRNVLGYLTGRKARKQIQRLEEVNASSGRLMPRERTNMQYVAQEMQEDMGVRGAVTPGARKVEHVIQGAPPGDKAVRQQAEMQPDTGGTAETSLLGEYSGEQETSLLTGGSQEAPPEAAEEAAEQEAPVINDGSTATLQNTAGQIGTFRIEREIILIHAEEVI